MSKKNIITIVVVVLVLAGCAAGGYYLWHKQKQTPIEKEIELKKRVVTNYNEKHPEYIHFKETKGGNVVLEDTKDKIKFEVLGGWKVEILVNEEESISFKFYSPEILKTFFPEEIEKNDCIFGIELYENSTMQEIRDELIDYWETLSDGYPENNFIYKEDSIDFLGYPALSISNTGISSMEPPTNTIFISTNDRVYEFWYVNWDDCYNQFNNFKKLIEIE